MESSSKQSFPRVGRCSLNYPSLSEGDSTGQKKKKKKSTKWDIAHGPILNRVTHVYTNGSAMNNDSPAECTSAAAWVSDSGASERRQITRMPSSNNITEIVAVAMALQAWQLTNLHIHTDSKLALRLLEGGLLDLEHNGWVDTPWTAFPPRSPPQSLRNVLRHLLHLVRAHQGTLSMTWVKAHAGHPLNEAADEAAKSALTSDNTVHLPALRAPAGWTDHAPALGGTPLDMLTRQVVQNVTAPPLSEAKCTPFLEAWSACLLEMTGIALDAGLHASRMWKLNIPTCLRELLWKDMTRSLLIGATWFGAMERGRMCSCGTELSLTHIWTGCDTHDLTPLLQTLRDRLPALPPAAPAWTHPWYPLLALRELESARRVGKKAAKELCKSWSECKWAIGSYLWLLWTNSMKEVHGEGFAPPWRWRWIPHPTCVGSANLAGLAHRRVLRRPHHPTHRDPSAKVSLPQGRRRWGLVPQLPGSGRRRGPQAHGPQAPTCDHLAGPRGTINNSGRLVHRRHRLATAGSRQRSAWQHPRLPGQDSPRKRPHPGHGVSTRTKAETLATRPFRGGPMTPSLRLTRAAVPWGFSG